VRAAGLLTVVLAAVSALAGIGIAVAAFAPIPFADSIDFFSQFFNAGGWHGYRFEQFYARHNEHRLVVPRLWFLADIWLFQGTQAFLIVVTIVSSTIHAVVLALVFRGLGHRGWVLWIFAAAALGAVLSPAQWENLVWGFQVQFIQVWLFATLAFVAVSRAEGRHSWGLVLAAVAAGLLSTYSMANGLLVWPVLVVLALWCGVRGGPLWLLLAVAAAVVGIEAAGFHAHPGHGDPLKTMAEPWKILRYAFRYLTNAIGAIGTRGQEIVGALLFLMTIGMAVDAVIRPSRYRPGHAVLLGIAGFVIGAALLTALGRVTFGLGQANATRYATPSFIFLLVCSALLLDRLVRVERPRLQAAATALGAALLLVPGLVDGAKHVPAALGERDARVNAVVSYLAGGYRPADLHALFPFVPRRPYRVLELLEANGWGPFADRAAFMPPAAVLADPPKPTAECRGHVDAAADDPVVGIAVRGWAAAADAAEHPEWVLVTDAGGAVVGWGGSRDRRDDVGAAIGNGWRGRGFHATGPNAATAPLSVVGVFADGRSCLLAAGLWPRAPRFLATLPVGARPATDGGWTVLEGETGDRFGPEPPPESVLPAVGTLGAGNSHLVAVIDLPPAGDGSALAVPVRSRRFPFTAVLAVRDAVTGEVIESHPFERPSDHAWTWRVFESVSDPRRRGHGLRVEVSVAGPQPWQGVAVGRPYWLPVVPRG